MTVLAVFVTNIRYLLTIAMGTNIQNMSPISKFCHQHPTIVTDIYVATILWCTCVCGAHMSTILYDLLL